MDLEKENLGLESVLDDEAVAKVGNFESGDHILSRIENNVTRGTEHGMVEGGKDTKLAKLVPVTVTTSTDSGSPVVSPGTTIKGKGLRKWRRIKREATQEGNLNVDNNRLLKRGLSGVGVQPGKNTEFLSEMRQMSEGSVSSSNEVLRNPRGLLDGFSMIDGTGLVMAPVFASGAESENNEDSLSTTAKVSKMRDNRQVIAGNLHDRNRAKISSGMSSSGLVQKVQQQGKKMARTSKKLRGQVSIDKQNSYSSMESDSRSPNVVLMLDSKFVASRGRQNGGENGEEAHGQGSDQFRTSYMSNNGREFEDVSQNGRSEDSSRGAQEENRAKQESSTDQDPLIESIHILQSVQEALEKEVQRFREIEIEDILATESTSSERKSVDSEVNEQSGNHSQHELEYEISNLKEHAHLTKIKLEETTALLKGKEADISELEAILDVGAELESIFRGKIEAEVKYLAISKTTRDLRVASVDQISILERRIASDESQNNLGNAESMDVKLMQGAKKLESDCKDASHDDIVKLQGNICKYTLCFLLQLILLLVILGLLVSQLSPHSTEVVPT